MKKLLLFDIDGTLILTGGAGKRGMTRAFEKIYGIANALEEINFSGMTDPEIFRLASGKFNFGFSNDQHEKFKAIYLNALREEIEHDHPEKRIMPGIVQLLETLLHEPDIILGVLTGNYATGAAIKLKHFGLNHYFECGAYGDDNEDRNKLVPFAVRRVPENHGAVGNKNLKIWVIGDTPRDIACARPHGATAVAVATGFHDFATLKAAEPDFLFQDLRDTQRVLNIFKGVG